MPLTPNEEHVGSTPTGLTKSCSACKQTKSIAEYSKNRTRSDGLQSHCRACHSKWYLANKKHHIERVQKHKRRRRSILKDVRAQYLLTHPCVDCGESDPIVLDFDHVRGEKIDDVSRLLWGSQCSLNVFETEMSKCDVRCANCHRRATHKRRIHSE